MALEGVSGGVKDLDWLLSQAEQSMRKADEAAAKAKSQQKGGGGGAEGAQGSQGAQGCQGAQGAPAPAAQQPQQPQQRADAANQVAKQKWDQFKPEAAPAAPSLPRARPMAAPSSSESAAPASAQATSAPSKLDKTLDKNPGIKTKQDLVNHYYKQGGGTWEGASTAAKKDGVSMSELVRDRKGDARAFAQAKRTGAPAAPAPSSPASPGVESPSSSAPTDATKPIAAKDKIAGGPDRSQFDKELQNPAVRDRMKALTLAEVGAKNPQAQRALMETIFNRAQATGKSLTSTMNDRYYAPFHDGGFARAQNELAKNPALGKQLDAAMFDVRRGSDVSHMATDNASGSVARSAERSQVITARIGGETFSRKEGLRNGVHHPDYRPWLKDHPTNPATPNA